MDAVSLLGVVAFSFRSLSTALSLHAPSRFFWTPTVTSKSRTPGWSLCHRRCSRQAQEIMELWLWFNHCGCFMINFFFFYCAKYLISLSGIFSLFFNFMVRFSMFTAHCLDISENTEKRWLIFIYLTPAVLCVKLKRNGIGIPSSFEWLTSCTKSHSALCAHIMKSNQ